LSPDSPGGDSDGSESPPDLRAPCRRPPSCYEPMAPVGVQGGIEVTLLEIRSHKGPKLGRPGGPKRSPQELGITSDGPG
jgi:hypothetical protein